MRCSCFFFFWFVFFCLVQERFFFCCGGGGGGVRVRGRVLVPVLVLVLVRGTFGAPHACCCLQARKGVRRLMSDSCSLRSQTFVRGW